MKSEMKPIKETIPLEEARQLIAEACRPIDRTERVRIVDANGRVAAARCRGVWRSPRCSCCWSCAIMAGGARRSHPLFPFEITLHRVVVWW